MLKRLPRFLGMLLCADRRAFEFLGSGNKIIFDRDKDFVWKFKGGRDMVYDKPMRTAEQLVLMMRNEKGIKFNIVDEQSAIDFLTKNNNYFRVASYRKNYNKVTLGEKAGHYENLEFAYLIELSTIDMHFRYIVIKMCLDIEHFLKIKLLDELKDCSEGEEYAIVNRFLSCERYKYIKKNIYFKRDGHYVCDLIDSCFTFECHKDAKTNKVFLDNVISQCPIWAFLEVLTFGEFTNFFNYCHELNSINCKYEHLLNSIRSLRNACAHNNCTLYNLRKGNTKPNPLISQFISAIPGIKKEERKTQLKCRPVYEFISLLYVYDNIVSNEVKRKRYEELRNIVIDRFSDKKGYFSINDLLKNTYLFTKKVVDFVTGC